LPSAPTLTSNEVKYIANCIEEVLHDK